MIYLDEPRKFNWEIKYNYLDDEKQLIPVISGKCYDFIPHKDEIIVIDNIPYLVNTVVYDFDESIIMVSLKKTK